MLCGSKVISRMLEKESYFKFIQFKLLNSHLNNSLVHRRCQLNYLEEEIRPKRKRINIFEKDTKRILNLSCLDFSCIYFLFLVANEL